MTREEAMQKAARLVSISGSRTSWTVTYPFYDDRPRGPSTSTTATSQAMAIAIARGIKARIAGALLGLTGDDLTGLQYAVLDGTPWRDAVRLYVNQAAQRSA